VGDREINPQERERTNLLHSLFWRKLLDWKLAQERSNSDRREETQHENKLHFSYFLNILLIQAIFMIHHGSCLFVRYLHIIFLKTEKVGHAIFTRILSYNSLFR